MASKIIEQQYYENYYFWDFVVKFRMRLVTKVLVTFVPHNTAEIHDFPFIIDSEIWRFEFRISKGSYHGPGPFLPPRG